MTVARTSEPNCLGCKDTGWIQTGTPGERVPCDCTVARTSKPKVTLRSSLYGEFDLDELVDRLCHSHAPKPQQRDIYNAQIAILRLIEIMRAAPETGGIPCSHCSGKGKTELVGTQDGWIGGGPCETCHGSGRLHTVEQYLKTLPADWHEDSSLETWFPLTAEIHERYKRALQTANGFLIMNNLEPVKLEYLKVNELKARARPCGDGCPGCDYCRSPSDSPPENGSV